MKITISYQDQITNLITLQREWELYCKIWRANSHFDKMLSKIVGEFKIQLGDKKASPSFIFSDWDIEWICDTDVPDCCFFRSITKTGFVRYNCQDVIEASVCWIMDMYVKSMIDDVQIYKAEMKSKAMP